MALQTRSIRKTYNGTGSLYNPPAMVVNGSAGLIPHYNPPPEGALPARYCSEICFCAGFFASGLSICKRDRVNRLDSNVE
ncbi:hypothetical protein J6590_071486 [Homalodisca vitripennis]|nr:hypothetical protein J6590_071486 [Homalodisca vitripennis]